MTFDRKYGGAAAPAKLQTPINGGIVDGSTFTVGTGSGQVAGYPVENFVIVVDRASINEEKIFCSARSGTTFTVGPDGRGFDETSAVNHDAQATVEHIYDAASATRMVDHLNDTELDDHTQYLTEDRHDDKLLHQADDSIPVGNPIAIIPGATVSIGTGGNLARANHRHPVDPWGVDADITASNPGDAADSGDADAYARADHVHGREAFGTADEIADVSVVAEAAGTSALVARADHVHRLVVDVEKNIGDELGLGLDLVPASHTTRGAALTILTQAITIARVGQIAMITGVLDIEYVAYAAAPGTVAICELYVDDVLAFDTPAEQIIFAVAPGGDHDRVTLQRTWWLSNLSAASHTLALKVWHSAAGNSAFARNQSAITTALFG